MCPGACSAISAHSATTTNAIPTSCPDGRAAATEILARPEYVGVSAEIIRASLSGSYRYSVQNAERQRDTTLELEVTKRKLRDTGIFGRLVGSSRNMKEIFRLVEMVAPSTVSVLITGESGTGKEMVARTIHDMSSRKSKPFLAINCSAIPETLIESEIFGHEKGAFTGALERRAGCFELAEEGTLLLDEIGEMPVGTQAKLLRV